MRFLLTIFLFSWLSASSQIKVEVPLTRTLAINGVEYSSGDPDTTYDATIGQFNLRGSGGSAVSGWADLSPVGDPHVGVRNVTDNGYNLSTNTTSAWNGLPATSGISGATSDDGGGFYHDAGGSSGTLNQSYVFNYNNSYSGATTDANFRVSGLAEDSIYVVDIVCSRATNSQTMKVIPHDKNGQGSTITTYWTGETLNAQNNTSKYVRLFLRADASGYAYFYIGGSTDNSTTSGVNIGYVNSVTIRKATITPYPY